MTVTIPCSVGGAGRRQAWGKDLPTVGPGLAALGQRSEPLTLAGLDWQGLGPSPHPSDFKCPQPQEPPLLPPIRYTLCYLPWEVSPGQELELCLGMPLPFW